MKHLVDTNVLSEARRAGDHPAVRAKLASIDDADLFVSVVTIGEIACGIARLPPGKQREDLSAWLAQTERHFADRVLPIDVAVVRVWGDLTAAASKAGRPLPAADGLIAATAVHHGLRLLTRNVGDFVGTGVQLVDPVDGASEETSNP